MAMCVRQSPGLPNPTKFHLRGQTAARCRRFTTIVALSLSLLNLAFQRTAEADGLHEDDRAVISAILASHAAVLESASMGSMVVRAVERTRAVTHLLDAEVVWQGDRIRWDYRHEQVRDGKSPIEISGVLLDTPTLIVNFERSHQRAFRAVKRVKKYNHVFRVTPRLGWFSYNFEFPLREIITADESWDYGNRDVSLEQNNDEITMTLSAPNTSGEFRIVFSAAHDGLPVRVRHSNAKGPRYHADYQWEQVDGVWYPAQMRLHSVVSGSFDKPRFELEITEFDPRPSIAADTFSESSLGITPDVELVTYREGQPPYVRRARPPELDDQLRQLGQRLSAAGFAAPED